MVAVGLEGLRLIASYKNIHMQVLRYPEKASWEIICRRPVMDLPSLETSVEKILQEVSEKGDQALKEFTLKFDNVIVNDLEVSPGEMDEALKLIPSDLKNAILLAKQNVEKFHSAQPEQIRIIETMPGIRCWRKSVAIEKVGLYIPGGTAPLFSTLLMLAIPAVIAGCREIVICSPPGKDGKLHPAILYAAHLTGITRIFKLGGVQAIAAMTFGTHSVPRVFKIFGPGNQYVTCAKQLAQRYGVAIDMPAGPSEVGVFADDTADPAFVAADLLSQAEHGPDSQVFFVCSSEQVLENVQQQLAIQLGLLPRRNFAAKSLENSTLVLVNNEQEAMELLNEYAPEHLILSCKNASALAELVVNAGSVFIGNYSPESVGDYASGTNHTLPTNGHARAYSGVSVDSFVKKITFQQLTPEGLKNIGPSVELMAAAEGLQGHKNAVSIRLAQVSLDENI